MQAFWGVGCIAYAMNPRLVQIIDDIPQLITNLQKTHGLREQKAACTESYFTSDGENLAVACRGGAALHIPAQWQHSTPSPFQNHSRINLLVNSPFQAKSR